VDALPVLAEEEAPSVAEKEFPSSVESEAPVAVDEKDLPAPVEAEAVQVVEEKDAPAIEVKRLAVKVEVVKVAKVKVVKEKAVKEPVTAAISIVELPETVQAGDGAGKSPNVLSSSEPQLVEEPQEALTKELSVAKASAKRGEPAAQENGDAGKTGSMLAGAEYSPLTLAAERHMAAAGGEESIGSC
jgi:hypothetical protein